MRNCQRIFGIDTSGSSKVVVLRRMSSSKITKARYWLKTIVECHVEKAASTFTFDFFLTDRIKYKEVRIEYCSTGDMIADFMIKLLQGSIFIKFRNLILGICEEDFELYKNCFAQILLKHGLTERSNNNSDSSSTKTELTTEPLHTTFVKPQECVRKLPNVRTAGINYLRMAGVNHLRKWRDRNLHEEYTHIIVINYKVL